MSLGVWLGADDGRCSAYARGNRTCPWFCSLVQNRVARFRAQQTQHGVIPGRHHIDCWQRSPSANIMELTIIILSR